MQLNILGVSLEQTKSISEENVEIQMTFGSQSRTCISFGVMTNVSCLYKMLTVEKLGEGDAEGLYCLQVACRSKIIPKFKILFKKSSRRKKGQF